MFCFFESSDSCFTRHGGKSLEKFFECLSAFQIVEESLDWHSRSTKHRSSAKNIRVFGRKRAKPKAVSVMKMKSGKNRTMKTVGCATHRRSENLPANLVSNAVDVFVE